MGFTAWRIGFGSACEFPVPKCKPGGSNRNNVVLHNPIGQESEMEVEWVCAALEAPRENFLASVSFWWPPAFFSMAVSLQAVSLQVPPLVLSLPSLPSQWSPFNLSLRTLVMAFRAIWTIPDNPQQSPISNSFTQAPMQSPHSM
jgi:hypothetical protein